MNLNLIANKKQDDIQAILYCAILFGDMKSISRILHPQGIFMGMAMLKFILSFKQLFCWIIQKGIRFTTLPSMQNKIKLYLRIRS